MDSLYQRNGDQSKDLVEKPKDNDHQVNYFFNGHVTLLAAIFF